MATIGGYPVKKFVRNCFLSVVGSTTAALSYRHLKKHPSKLKKTFAYSFIGGATGVILGSCYGLVKKSPNMYVKGVAGGLNFFLITGCYVGVRQALEISDSLRIQEDNRKTAKYELSAASGAITGFVVGSFWWLSIFRILTTSVSFCTFSAVGQFFNDRYADWKLKRIIQTKYPELAELEWQVLDDSERRKLIKKQQGMFSWLLELLKDRPYSGKLKLKMVELDKELVLLDEEEQRLKAKLNILEELPEEPSAVVVDAR